jgi:hypothetical protein
MENLSKLLGKVLAEKKLSRLWKWALINSIIQNFLKEFNINEPIQGKLQHHIYIVKTSNPIIWNVLFTHKKQILEKVNSQLKKMEFDPILDLKILSLFL